jgi:hypothetical protein
VIHSPASVSRPTRSTSSSTATCTPTIDTDAGRLLLAGQCYRDASSFARALTALRLAQSGYADAQATPDWLPHLLELEPHRVAFGHDHAVWQPDA